MLAILAMKGCHLTHFNINNVFLYGGLNEKIYIKPPKGLLIQGENTNLVCRLHKSLYGLKQASR